MKKLMKAALYALTALVMMSGCKDKDDDNEDTTPVINTGTVKLHFGAEWQGAPYATPGVVLDNFGNQLRIDKFTSYLSALALIKEDGTEHLLQDYSLVNFLQTQNMEFTVPKGNYTGIKFMIGVPADVNTNTDPAQYPNSHVLSVAGSQGMFWNWASGYIFTKLEGKADTTATDQPLLYPFSYHTGNDNYTSIVTLNDDINVQASGVVQKNITSDIYHIFSPVSGSPINMRIIDGFHSPGVAMSAFVNNLSNSLTLE
jgi:hypothetical protein